MEEKKTETRHGRNIHNALPDPYNDDDDFCVCEIPWTGHCDACRGEV